MPKKFLLALLAFTALASALLLGPAGFGPGGQSAEAARAALLKSAVPSTSTFNASSLSCASSSVGLVSWWPADGDANDAQGTNNGTLAGGVGFAAGKAGQAFDFDGSGEVVIPGTTSLNVQEFTIAAWVFATTLDGQIDIIVNKEPETGFDLVLTQYEIGIRGPGSPGAGTIPEGNLAFFIGGIGSLPTDFGLWVDGGGAIPLNTWTHVALTFDGGTAKTYIDSLLTRTVAGLSGSVGASSSPLKIGSRSDFNIAEFPLERFDGLIDEVRIYDRALTAQEVQSSFEGTCERIAFQSNRDGNWEIYVMDADGGAQTNLTNDAASDIFVALSPDGSKIAFVSDRDGDFDVYVMNADGSGETNLTNNSSLDYAPAWSPDGSKIAFRSDRDGNPEVYVMDADGGAQTNLTNNPALDTRPTWSPDGSKIAFYSDRDGNREVYVMDAAGGAQTNLTNNPAQDSDPAWSPDGSKIAFDSDRDGNWEIYVMDAAGTAQTNLTNHAARDVWPAWSPDGSKIAFDSDRDGNREVYVMGADGGVQTRLTNNPNDDQFPNWQSISMKQPTNYRALAEHWAPVIYQDTDGLDVASDFITRFDFDGDFDGTNNWENVDNLALPLKAYVYDWVIETSTNWFIGYALYHPRDWGGTGVIEPYACLADDYSWWNPLTWLGEFPVDAAPDPCHENDMEGILLTIQKDGSEFGQFLLMNTIYHHKVLSYHDPSSATSMNITAKATNFNWEGEVLFDDGISHPRIYSEAQGHAITGEEAWETSGFPGGDGVKYIYTGTAEMPDSGSETNVGYDLLPIQDLWSLRCDTGDEKTFAAYGTFNGDNWADDSANVPWAWDFSAEKREFVGLDLVFFTAPAPAFFLYPFTVIGAQFNGLGPFSLTDVTGSSFSPGPANMPSTGCVQEILGEIAWVTYDNVKEAGDTTLTTSETGPPAPSGYQPGNVPLYFGLTTTSTFTGEVEICANYDGTDYSLEGSLQMLHDSGAGWDTVTTFRDIVLNRVCGVVSSFSTFLIAELIPAEDYDSDGCSNSAELGLDVTLGGFRDPLNPWDFYDVDGLEGGPDGYIDLLFDILGVIQHYSPTGAPPYDVAFDRGPSSGPNPWDMTAPDGVIDLLNDILGVIQQYDHDCR